MRKLKVYTGKSDSESGGISLCSRVVLHLMKGLEKTGLLLYDNYYTSPTLFNHLYTRGINACGTAHYNRRHFAKDLVTKVTSSNGGFSDYRANGPLLSAVWVDKQPIYFVSNLHPSKYPVGMEPSTVKRRKLDGTQEDVSCPPLLPDYQKFMRGVDRGDQLQSYYNIGRRSCKWWKRIFFCIIEVSILNAYVLDSMFGHPDMLSQEREERYAYVLDSYVRPSRHAVSGEGREICLCPGQLCSAIPACCLRRGKRDMLLSWTVMFGHLGMLSQEKEERYAYVLDSYVRPSRHALSREGREICLCPGQLCSAIPACCLRRGKRDILMSWTVMFGHPGMLSQERKERYAYVLDSYVRPSWHAVSGRGKRDMLMSWTVKFGHLGMLSQEEGREICLCPGQLSLAIPACCLRKREERYA